MHREEAKCTLIGNNISDNGEMGIAVQDGAQVLALKLLVYEALSY